MVLAGQGVGLSGRAHAYHAMPSTAITLSRAQTSPHSLLFINSESTLDLATSFDKFYTLSSLVYWSDVLLGASALQETAGKVKNHWIVAFTDQTKPYLPQEN